MGVSLAVLLWVIWPGKQAKFNYYSRIPLRDDVAKQEKGLARDE